MTSPTTASRAAEYVAFDLETTGLSPKTDRIIEVGAVRFSRHGEVGRFEVLVDPGAAIPLAVQRLTGIVDSDVRGAAGAEEAVAQLADFCDGAELIAHGAQFDVAFVGALLPEAFGRRMVLDTLELARILLPREPSHSLPLLSAQLGLEHLRPHRALSDSTATRDLFVHLIDRAETLPSAVLSGLRSVLASLHGPLPQFFGEVVRGDGSAKKRRPLDSPAAAALEDPPAPVAAVPLPPGMSLDTVAATMLSPGGAMAGLQEQYEYRPQQVEMTRAVAQSLDRQRHLLVEAGTGVGKSLAYLLPLALWAQQRGERAVVATHTIALQEQLALKDLPLLNRLLPVPVEYAMLKGRQQYISLRRWERFLAAPEPQGRHLDWDRIRFKLKVLCWLAETGTGDRSELRLVGHEEQLWQLVESQSADCLGPVCAHWQDGSCRMVSARRAAAGAQLVITTHALLLADAERDNRLLAAHRAVVVDEAHHLEAAATEQLGVRLRSHDLLAVLERLPATRHPELEATLRQCDEAIHRAFGEAKGLITETYGNDQPGNVDLALSEAVTGAERFQPVTRAAAHAVQLLRTTAVTLRDLRGSSPLQQELLPQPQRVDDELELAAIALEQGAAAIATALLQPRPGHVRWLSLRAEQAVLREAPSNVANHLATRLFEPAETVVLTSASLSVSGGFEFVRGRTGLVAGADELLLRSPFDYLSQALTVVCSDMPPWDAHEHDRAMAELCAGIALRLSGRTLVLFTGYAPLRRVHALLGRRLEQAGIAVLGQGLDGTRRQLVGAFVRNQRTVLLGTSSFWEGIDVPGDALSCVVIDKLPFPVPTDPLIQARGAELSDPFSQLILPLAVLRLKQGFGRLIRRSTDRGAVVLCDDRLRRRDYGARFLEAMPPTPVAIEPVTSIPATVMAFVSQGTVPPGASVRAAAAADPWGGHGDDPA